MRTIVIVTGALAGPGVAGHAIGMKHHTGLPIDGNGMLVLRPDLRVGRDIVSLTSVQHPRAAFLAGTRPAADALRS